MNQTILQYRLDAVAFDVVLITCALLAHHWLTRRHGRGLIKSAWALIALLLVGGFALPEYFGDREVSRMRSMLAGIAPTYAQELQLAGHQDISLDTPTDDPKYLSLIAAQIRWVKANPNVADVYTFRRDADETVRLIVDAETDYDRNGLYDGEEEQRTSIGETYEETTPNMIRAFSGVAAFDDVPETDRWGTWISSYVPLYRLDGSIDGILGVDYAAGQWNRTILDSRMSALAGVAILAIISIASTFVVVITQAELKKRIAAEQEREKLQKQLLLSSRQAGMAEIATNVLHNVGNVLNSVNISAGVVKDNLSKSKVAAFSKATAMIQDHRSDIGAYLTTDERGKLLPDYLVKLSGVLASEQEAMLGEMTALTRSVDHIKQIVASQQAVAKFGGETEAFRPIDVIEDAVRMTISSLERHNVTLTRHVADIGEIQADRHKLLQILVNFLSNAKNAVKDNDGDRTIELRVEPGTGDNNQPTLRLAVSDNGIGISRDNLSKIFSHGFTTRQDGHGFGLHSSANTAQQMKGRVTVHSDGIGHGATFIVEIPLNAVEATAS